jgi:ketosteroid isomerase-like protein
MTLHIPVALLALLGGVTACRSEADARADRHQILALYEQTRAAHFLHDATGMHGGYDSTWLVVANGTIAARVKPAAEEALSRYLATMDFDEVADATPPSVVVAAAGDVAWLIGHVRVRARHRQPDGSARPVAFESAFIDLYRRIGGRWRVVVHGDTQREMPAGARGTQAR